MMIRAFRITFRIVTFQRHSTFFTNEDEQVMPSSGGPWDPGPPPPPVANHWVANLRFSLLFWSDQGQDPCYYIGQIRIRPLKN